MNATAHKGASIMLAVLLAAAITPLLFMDSSDANPGDTEADPLIWWNNTIILLPEVVAGETDMLLSGHIRSQEQARDKGCGRSFRERGRLFIVKIAFLKSRPSSGPLTRII